ncbi:hypothetical protein [Sphingobium nicotianae]|uniref:Uncharacterized protein n=1 Tax=Sphingobium nicotianae TaxID=2782607 RepID=A0A9X1DBY0_9SPHN|nr:hypothetical protein [Sphingobium nicotianae]MBT2187177.1 hypothetical protein [Sphingobium nicotianae]
MKPIEPFRPARPSPIVRRVHAIAATLAIVAVSAGLYALDEAGVIGQGLMVWAAIILVPLTTCLTIALEWRSLNLLARDKAPRREPIDIVKLFQEDLGQILANRGSHADDVDHRTP